MDGSNMICHQSGTMIILRICISLCVLYSAVQFHRFCWTLSITTPDILDEGTHQSNSPPTLRYIQLNVGGVIYMTSQETLTRYPDSMLGRMFTQERTSLAKDDQGRIFIDRDGASFRYILNFLRNGRTCLPDNPADYSQMLEEARFYRLEELVEEMSVHLNVNGIHYTTTRAVLTRDERSLLTELFAKELPLLAKDQDGRYLLRNSYKGELFEYILNYLGEEDFRLPETFHDFEELGKLAEHYKLEAITRALQACLVVGDKEFTTTRAILAKDKGSLLDEVFSQTPIPLERDRLGRFVIDRDGEMFRYILNFLEDGELGLRRGVTLYHSQFDPEVDYYKLGTLQQSKQIKIIIDHKRGESSIAWKYLTKYKGSLLEEKFAKATVSPEGRYSFYEGDGRSLQHILQFLETGNLAHVPKKDYPKLLEEAGRYRLRELGKLLADLEWEYSPDDVKHRDG